MLDCPYPTLSRVKNTASARISAVRCILHNARIHRRPQLLKTCVASSFYEPKNDKRLLLQTGAVVSPNAERLLLCYQQQGSPDRQ